MSATIDDLLLLSRTGEREGQGEAVDLAEAVADARRRWQRAAAAREVALHAEPDGAGVVWASRADLDRAVDAVVENAIHYTPAGGQVTVRGVAGGDRGARRRPGPRARARRTTCSPASTAARPAAAARPGTGLGLPIARELMRTWGGDAALANRPEGGTRATLTAPAFTGSFPGTA